MYKVRIKKKCGGPTHMQDGGTTEDLTNTITSSMGAVPREEANIEVEKGESAFGDINGDSFAELMFFGGKRHTQGGTPVNVPPGTFIFSDTKKLRIKDPELLEKFFNITNPKKKGYTPAEISKQYKDFNKHMDALKDPESDQIRIGTATEMVENITHKLGALALIQESMKGFPDGIPSFAESAVAALGIDPQEIIAATQPQQPVEGMQQMPTGQPESMPLLPEAQVGGMQMQMAALSKFLPQSENGGAIKVVIKQPLKEMPKMQGGGSTPSESGYYDFKDKTYYFDADAGKWQVESSYKPGVFVYLKKGDIAAREQMLNNQATPSSGSKVYSYEKMNSLKGDDRWGVDQLSPEQWNAKRLEIENSGYTSDNSVIFRNKHGDSYSGEGFRTLTGGDVDAEKFREFMDALATGEDQYGNTIGEENAEILWQDYLKAYESGDKGQIDEVKGIFDSIDIPGSWDILPWTQQDKLEDLNTILDERVEKIEQDKEIDTERNKAGQKRGDYEKLLMLKKFQLEHPTENTNTFNLRSEINEMEKTLEKYPEGHGVYYSQGYGIKEKGKPGLGISYNWERDDIGGENVRTKIYNSLQDIQTEGFNFLQTTGEYDDDPITQADPNLIDITNINTLDDLNALWENRNTKTIASNNTTEINWDADEVEWEIDDEF